MQSVGSSTDICLPVIYHLFYSTMILKISGIFLHLSLSSNNAYFQKSAINHITTNYGTHSESQTFRALDTLGSVHLALVYLVDEPEEHTTVLIRTIFSG